MLSVNIRIENINYEQTVTAAFPLLKRNIQEMNAKHIALHLLQKLDDKALPVLLNVMQYMSKDAKDEIMIAALNGYSALLCDKLKSELSCHPIGKHLKIAQISADKAGNAIYLHFRNVECDYYALVRENVSGLRGFGLGIVAGISGPVAELLALKRLWTEENKEKLLILIQNTITQYGLAMDLADMDLANDTVSDNSSPAEREGKLLLSDELLDAILDALAQYLRNTVEYSETKGKNEMAYFDDSVTPGKPVSFVDGGK